MELEKRHQESNKSDEHQWLTVQLGSYLAICYFLRSTLSECPIWNEIAGNICPEANDSA